MFTRRNFLARTGILGIAAGSPLLTQAFYAQPFPTQPAAPIGIGDLVRLLRPLLQELSRDTINGLTTFVVPGPDAYSRAQGTPRPEPGALEAKTTDFMMTAVDNFVPFPQQLASPIATALTTALSDLGIELPGPLAKLLPAQVRALDDALRFLLRNDAAIPLSLVAALLLNLLATRVNPLSINGPFASPFSRLSYGEKSSAFALLEGPDADLVAALDTSLPEPLRGSLSGLLRFFGGGLLEFVAFGAYNEWAVFDARTKQLKARPVGWRLSGYDGVSDGWDDFKGYYQGRRRTLPLPQLSDISATAAVGHFRYRRRRCMTDA